MTEFWKDWYFYVILVGTVVIVVIATVISSIYNNYDKYLNSISPRIPRWVFPFVWTVIYVLTIIGTYLQIYFSKASETLSYMTLFFWGVQLLMGLFWTVSLNVYDSPRSSLLLAYLYLIAVVLQGIFAVFMWPWALFFLVPIAGWLCFAIYLNTQMVNV